MAKQASIEQDGVIIEALSNAPDVTKDLINELVKDC